MSQLRLTVEYRPAGAVRRALTTGRLHVDIVDYPGEWLLDLPLMDLDFTQWSSQALADARARGGQPAARAWLDFLAALDPASAADEPRARVLEWLMFQMGNVGPMFGQCYHFKSSAPERIPYAIERYTREVGRLYNVMDRRLGKSAYLGGDAFSIADIATFPWTKNPPAYDQDPDDFPNVKRWIDAIKARPTVKRAYTVLDAA